MREQHGNLENSREFSPPLNYFSYRNREVLYESMKILQLHHDVDKTILELGIGNRRKFLNTSTFLLTCFKHPNVKYIGVDFRGRGWLHDVNENVYVYRSKTEYFLPTFNEEIDLLLIDGGHSVDNILIDWQFSSFVKNDGIILLHDIKVHPGPNVLIDAIDTEIYKVDRYFLDDEDDFGIAVVYKKEAEYDGIRS